MVDAPNFNLQNNFPISTVIDAAQKKAVYEQQFKDQQNALLLKGVDDISGVATSLAQKRAQVAQALAQAKIFGQTPEGQQILGTNNVTTSPMGTPQTMNQTAQGTDASGNLLPAPVSNKSPVGLNDIATAIRGEQPGNFLGNLQAQSNTRKQLNLEASKEANSQKLAQERTKQILAVLQGNMGLGYTKVNEQTEGDLRKELESLKTQNGNLSKQLPSAGMNALSSVTGGLFQGQGAIAAKNQLDANNQRIAKIESQLAGNKNGSASHLSTADLLAIANQ